MMKKLILFSAITFSIISCNKLPNEKTAEEAVKSKISELSTQNVELTKFKKINAQEQNIFGVEIYEIEFDGKIKYKKSGFIHEYSVKSVGLKNDNFLIIKNEVEPYLSKYYSEVKNNEEKNITGKIAFEKKENGWSPKSPFIKIKK